MRVVCVFCFVNRSKLTLQGKFCLKVLSVPVQVFLQPVDLLSAFLDVKHFVHQVVHVADTGHHWLPAGGLGHVWRSVGGLHNRVEWGEFFDLLCVLLYTVYIYIYIYIYIYTVYIQLLLLLSRLLWFLIDLIFNYFKVKTPTLWRGHSFFWPDLTKPNSG